MATNANLLEQALVQERARNGRQIAVFRVVGACAILAANSLFLILRREYIGAPMLPLTAYSLAAVVLWWLQGRFEPVARWGGLAVALVDMPVIFALISSTMQTLRATEYAHEAPAVAVQACAFYLVFIWAASLTLRTPYTWLAAGAAIVLQTLLLADAERDVSFIAMMDIATALGTSLCLYSRTRSVALVAAAALEQSRRERLGRYFSPSIAAAVIDAEAELTKGRSYEVSVLFADIRDFTALAERLRSDQVVDLLNEFHTAMVECIFRRGGTLDKYLGDGLMAYFGAPVVQPDHADRAVLCTVDMHAALAALNRDLARRGLPSLRMGIGVHTGSVILGDVGAARRREFTAIGDTVNVAARVEQLTKTCGALTLVTEETRRQVTADLRFAPVEPLTVKGKSAPLQTYRVE